MKSFIITLFTLFILIKSKSLSANEITILSNSTISETEAKNNTENFLLKRKVDSANKNTNSNKAKAFDNSQCGLLMQGAICISNGNRVFLPSATPNNLAAHYTFDDKNPLDESGNSNHAQNTFESGSAFGGLGYSALFQNGNFLEVPHSQSFEGKDFAITFWFYLIKKDKEELGMKICPLMQKGKDDLFNKNYNRYPGIYLDRKEHKFKIYLKTNTPGLNLGESLFSNGRAVLEKWSHISIVKNQNKLTLYINGILDNSIDLKGIGIENKDPFYIGGSPAYQDQCKFDFLLDELKYYNKSIDADFIQAEASPALGAIEPNFLQIGCLNCDIETASKSCNEGYRLCSSVELHSAGYMIAMANGLVNFETHIWTSSALKKIEDWKDIKGLGLCCVEIK